MTPTRISWEASAERGAKRRKRTIRTESQIFFIMALLLCVVFLAKGVESFNPCLTGSADQAVVLTDQGQLLLGWELRERRDGQIQTHGATVKLLAELSLGPWPCEEIQEFLSLFMFLGALDDEDTVLV
jgi:hypothetical protein